jgi:hypothetical protein
MVSLRCVHLQFLKKRIFFLPIVEIGQGRPAYILNMFHWPETGPEKLYKEKNDALLVIFYVEIELQCRKKFSDQFYLCTYLNVHMCMYTTCRIFSATSKLCFFRIGPSIQMALNNSWTVECSKVPLTTKPLPWTHLNHVGTYIHWWFT